MWESCGQNHTMWTMLEFSAPVFTSICPMVTKAGSQNPVPGGTLLQQSQEAEFDGCHFTTRSIRNDLVNYTKPGGRPPSACIRPGACIPKQTIERRFQFPQGAPEDVSVRPRIGAQMKGRSKAGGKGVSLSEDKADGSEGG